MFTQKALEETPDLPPNEYKWWGCLLEYESIHTQIVYYQHWRRYGNKERVSRDEINKIIKLGCDQ
jgi:hypothetical protein